MEDQVSAETQAMRGQVAQLQSQLATALTRANAAESKLGQADAREDDLKAQLEVALARADKAESIILQSGAAEIIDGMDDDAA